MELFFDILRNIGIITGLPFDWIVFSKKYYYEDKSVQSRRIKGGALVISNHFNPFDYVANVFTVYPRKLYVVASEIAFQNKLITFGMRFWGGIQANRVTRSMRFVDESADVIKKGRVVQIFPEGHNTDDGTIKKFYPSYIAIALKAKAPIIPIITDGNYGLFKRLHVIIGKPINVYDYLDSEEYTRQDIYRINDIVRNKVLDLRADLDRRMDEDGSKKGNNKK